MNVKKYWKNVWETKGNLLMTDLNIIDGYDNIPVSPEEIAKLIIKDMNIKSTDKVLDVGCGAGGTAQLMADLCFYVGIDYSPAMINKHLELFNHQVMVSEANDIPFKDKYFDKTFCFSCFQYFPSKYYAFQTLQEMQRVAREVYVYDLPIGKSHRPEHLTFDLSDFNGWQKTKGFYNPKRINIKKV